MPLIYFSRVSGNREEFFFARDSVSTTYNDSSDFKLEYEKLPYHLKSCLDYCSFATFKGSKDKDKLVRLLMAEDLVQEIPGKIMEEVAETNLQDLMSLGMLCQDLGNGLEVEENYKEISLIQVQEKDFVSSAANSPVFALIYDDGKDIPPNFHGLRVCSLFIVTFGRRSTETKRGLSCVYMESICELHSLFVLDLDGIIENLPDGIGNLVNLRYLSFNFSGFDEFPKSLFTLQELQTLDIRGSGLGNWHELPIEALKLKKLRHLLMFRDGGSDFEVKVPEGFGSMVNLHICDGVYGGGGIAKELGNLTQLCKLGVKRLANDHSDEIVASISKMTGLVSLSLEAEGTITKGTLFPEMEQFSPPPILREVNLVGGLVDIPNWLFSIRNLTILSLSYSRLSENQISVLQSLPKLKSLCLNNACDAKFMSKRFCGLGGFNELKTLEISSRTLVEWGEIVDGAFPSLRFLTFSNCVKLKFLPEGLQNVSTLERLCILPVYTEIARRLKGEESYKIKHIKEVILYEFPSALLHNLFAVVPNIE